MKKSALDKKIKALLEQAKKLPKKKDSQKNYTRRPTFLDGIKTKEQSDIFNTLLHALVNKKATE
jgi:hypothetical protein